MGLLRIYINELSLIEQFHSPEEFDQGLRNFSSILALLASDSLRGNLQVFYTNQIKQRKSGPAAVFASHLDRVRDKSVKTHYFLLLVNQLAAINWDLSPIQDGKSSYNWGGELVSGSSLAEGAEYCLRQGSPTAAMLNFERSQFKALFNVMVFKNGYQSAHMDSFDDLDSVLHFLEEQFRISAYVYPDDAQDPPTDRQTVLRDSTRFSKSGKPSVQGRRVYFESPTGRFWHVDNFHRRRSAHLEVYDGAGVHIGEATLDGSLDPSKAKPGRHI